MEFNQRPQEGGHTTYEKSARRTHVLVGVLIALLVGTGLWWQMAQKDQVRTPEADNAVTRGHNTNEQVTPGSLSGLLYYTTPTVLIQDSEHPSQSYAYDIAGNSVEPTITSPARDAQVLSNGLIALVAPVDGDNTSRSWQPQQYDPSGQKLVPLSNVAGYYVNDIKYAADGKHFAYNYRSEENPPTNFGYLTDWKIAIHDTESTEVMTLDSAAEPEWINGGADLLYISPEGVFRYNVASKTTTRVWSDFVPFGYGDDMAVSPDSKKVVLTIVDILGMRMIAVLQFAGGDSEHGELTLQTMKTVEIAQNDSVFTHPVFSPDGTYFAVATGRRNAGAAAGGLAPYEDVIEIRPVSNLESVHTLSVPNPTHTEISLEAWLPAITSINQ